MGRYAHRVQACQGEFAPKTTFLSPLWHHFIDKRFASRYAIDNYFSPMVSNNGQVSSESSGLSRFNCPRDIIALISVLGKCLCIKIPWLITRCVIWQARKPHGGHLSPSSSGSVAQKHATSLTSSAAVGSLTAIPPGPGEMTPASPS